MVFSPKWFMSWFCLASQAFQQSPQISFEIRSPRAFGKGGLSRAGALELRHRTQETVFVSAITHALLPTPEVAGNPREQCG